MAGHCNGEGENPEKIRVGTLESDNKSQIVLCRYSEGRCRLLAAVDGGSVLDAEKLLGVARLRRRVKCTAYAVNKVGGDNLCTVCVLVSLGKHILKGIEKLPMGVFSEIERIGQAVLGNLPAFGNAGNDLIILIKPYKTLKAVCNHQLCFLGIGNLRIKAHRVGFNGKYQNV